MSGINDIKNAFAKAAPGIDLRAVRMVNNTTENMQELQFDICGPHGEKHTIVELVPHGGGMKPLMDATLKLAADMMAAMDRPQDNVPSQMPLAEKAAEGIAKLISVSEPVSAPVEIEHQGEKYELAHDGSPQTLFF